jgi:hypothetical protein
LRSQARRPVFSKPCAGAVLALVLATAPLRSTAQSVAIDCKLADAKGAHFAYSFDYVPSKGTLALTDGSGELRTERHTASELLASYRGSLAVAGAEVAYFRIDLTTGAAQVAYVHEPTAAEVQRCERERAFGCRDPVVLAASNESGLCSLQEH